MSLELVIQIRTLLSILLGIGALFWGINCSSSEHLGQKPAYTKRRFPDPKLLYFHQSANPVQPDRPQTILHSGSSANMAAAYTGLRGVYSFSNSANISLPVTTWCRNAGCYR